MSFGFGFGYGLGSPVNAGRVFDDGAWLQSQVSAITLEGLRRPIYRFGLAQTIRDSAGIPSGIEVGIQTGVTPGVSAGASLTPTARTVIINEAGVQALASSGTGAELDPYIINELSFTGAGNENLVMGDATATYYVKFVDCLFGSGTQENIQLSGTENLEFENCEFYNNNANAEIFSKQSGGNLTFTSCLFSGCNSSTALNIASGASGTVTMRNVKIDNSQNDFATGCHIFFFNDTDVDLDAQYIESNLVTNTGDCDAIFQLLKSGSVSIQNFKCDGKVRRAVDDTFDSSLTSNNKTDFLLRYFDIDETTDNSIHLSGLSGDWFIGYGEIDMVTAGSGAWPFVLESDSSSSAVRVTDGEVAYIAIDKQSGTAVAGNEAIEFIRTKGINIHDIWVKNGTEDGMEFVQSMGGHTIVRIVLDNIANQAMDWFKQWNEGTWTEYATTGSAPDLNDYVSFVYGDCGAEAIIISGVRAVIGHDIYIDNTAAAASTDYINCTTVSTAFTFNCKFSGPLPLPANREETGDVFVVNTSGTGNEAQFFDSQDGTSDYTTV